MEAHYHVSFELPQALDKENVNWQRQPKVMTHKSPFKSPARRHHTPYSTPLKTPFSTPARNTPDVPGSSKLLRQHFQHLSLTPKRRLVESGARRNTATMERRLIGRVGYDGTNETPSKELLKSTTASRSQRVVDTQYSQEDDWSLSVDVSLDSTMMQMSVGESPRSIGGSRDFQDPVALTLSNEDYDMDIVTVPKVASTLLDVMDDDVATSLVRPLPRRRY